MNNPQRLAAGTLGLLILVEVGGCVQRPAPVLLSRLPMHDAVALVDANVARIGHTLKASGSADGYFTTAKGRRRSFHVDATMFFLTPRYLRFDLKKLGERQMLIGSNEERYWFYSREDDSYTCGRHGIQIDPAEDLPITPRQIIEALGLTGIPRADFAIGPVQRVVDEYQQLLYFTEGAGGPRIIEREIWLDRHAPRLIGKVVFRDADGAIEMQSELTGYERLGAVGPWLPGVMRVHWPKSTASLRFKVSRWTFQEEVAPDGLQFAVPPECDVR